MSHTQETFSVTIEDPETLSKKDLDELHEVTQDMWAYGIGEFVQCHDCGVVSSKCDIFGELGNQARQNTVKEIMNALGLKDISCPHCGGVTKFIYGKEFIDHLRKKLSHSVHSVLAVARTEGRIVGYMDGYIDSFHRLYQNDLSQHYSSYSEEFLKHRVEMLLQRPADYMVYFSEAGFIQRYASLGSFFSLYRPLFDGFSSEYDMVPGITELDRNNKNLFNIYRIMGSKTIDLDQEKVTANHGNYVSSIAVFDSPIHDFKTKFNCSAKEFVRHHMRRKAAVHEISK